MKNINRTALFLLVSVFSFITHIAFPQTSSGELFKLNVKEIDRVQLNLAESMAKKILGGMKSKNYYILDKNEAIPQLLEQFGSGEQTSFYKKIVKDMGHFKGDLNFEEAYFIDKVEGKEDLVLYRFKSRFEYLTSEVRVYYQKDDNLLSGFLVTAWIDQIYDYSKRRKELESKSK